MSIVLVKRTTRKLSKFELGSLIEYNIPSSAPGFCAGEIMNGIATIVKILEDGETYPIGISRLNGGVIYIVENEISRIIS